MGRGVSSGGGQSSLGYMFGGGDRPAAKPTEPAPQPQQQPAPPAPAAETPAPQVARPGLGRSNNNYHRSDGQNTGNFITDRPTTKVAEVPGGTSSLNYLFGSQPGGK